MIVKIIPAAQLTHYSLSLQGASHDPSIGKINAEQNKRKTALLREPLMKPKLWIIFSWLIIEPYIKAAKMR